MSSWNPGYLIEKPIFRPLSILVICVWALSRHAHGFHRGETVWTPSSRMGLATARDVETPGLGASQTLVPACQGLVV